MPMITFVCPEQLSAKIDNIVSERRKLPKYRELTPMEKREAIRIAKKEGPDASNEYIRSLQLAQRHSRASVIIEILNSAIK